MSEQPVGPERLTRADVDKLLKQARQSIEQKNWDQAEAFVSRAEKTGIRYPLFHFGATPKSVRRDLLRARRAHGQISARTNPTRSAVASSDSAARTSPFPAPSVIGNGKQGNIPTSPQNLTAPLLANVNSVSQASAAMPIDQPLPAILEPLPNIEGLGTQADNPFKPQGNMATRPSPEPRKQTADFLISDALKPTPPLPYGSRIGVGNDTARFGAPADSKSQALQQMSQSRQALSVGDLDRAEELARQASALNVPESQFLPKEDRPSQLAWDIRQARENQKDQAPAQASPLESAQPKQQVSLVDQQDASQNVQAMTLDPPANNLRLAQLPGSNENLPLPISKAPISEAPTPGAQLLQQGEAALRQGNHGLALQRFQQANAKRNQLDPASRQRLEGHLQLLATAPSELPAKTKTSVSTNASTLIDTVEGDQQVLARQLSAEVGKRQSEARRIREQDPKQALKILQEIDRQIADSNLPERFRTQLTRRIARTREETEQYIQDHSSEIELEEQNNAVLAENDRRREVKVKVQEKVATLVNEFNQLRDEQRYAEMQIVARRLYELAPEEPVAQQVWSNSKFILRSMSNRDLSDRREESYWATLDDVEQSSVQEVGDGHEMIFDETHWNELAKGRKGSRDRNKRLTERELEIQRRLKTPILLRYEDTPLSEVVEGLSKLAGVNIHLDPRGLSQEGIHSDSPVTINLNQEITLESALNLILEPMHLSYMIKDEVLKITSEQLRDGDISPEIYNVADLVIPIPNFVPNSSIGLQGLIHDAHASMGYGAGGLGSQGPAVLVNDRQPQNGMIPGSDQVLAQQFSGAGGGMPSSVPIGSGPGGLGGGANADFDSLIELIVATVATESWAENGGGEAEIRPFPTTLSLVVSQTRAVHEEIADLLEQLRRLQDLQVTIEVRFIRLNDSFFERIGIDFDMNIEDRTFGTADLTPGTSFEPGRNSAIVGLLEPINAGSFPAFATDLDIPFRQETNMAVPAFGSPVDVATFGFAILSDIEAYFLIEAAQGDRRTNILNAPKVTLFNGQQAFVADAVSMPFVIGVIPVVGEFAVAQQPVIVVLNEGTLMTIQAVVSDDRRYVRLTVVPFFTQVGNVQEFTFDGSSSSTNSSSTTDDDDDGNNEQNNNSANAVRSGVTVQLPAFQFVSVVTTVSVPDGGTVLLGGIKRLSEGRSEFGVPLLSKVPYINRLFRNVGIGRETDSLMMMVTPRIIIQEEEEDRLLGSSN